MLCKHEKRMDSLCLLSDYINGANNGYIEKLCAGDVLLPSPLCVILAGKKCNIEGDISKKLLDALCCSSGDFYDSLITFPGGDGGIYFTEVSDVLGQRFISILANLRSSVLAISDSEALLRNSNSSNSFIKIFKYPFFWGGVFIIFALCLTLFSVSIEVVTNGATAFAEWFLYAAFMFSCYYGLLLKSSNSFTFYDNKGKDILASRYKDFLEEAGLLF